EGDGVVDPDLLRELPAQGIDERLARIHPPAGEQPVVLVLLLVAAEQNAIPPVQERRDPDPRLAQFLPDDPKPPSPRSLGGSSSTSRRLAVGTATTRSWAILMPGSTTKGACLSVL